MQSINKILVVDDSLAMRYVLSHFLNGEGYEVQVAANGLDGLKAAEELHPDLIITDINMPVMGGYEFIRCLRGLPQYRLTPVLIFTTESTTEQKSKGREVGASGWVTKPYDSVHLLTAVRRLLH